MPRAPPPAGFALIIVLWTIVLLSLLVVHIENFGRSEARRALNLREAAALQAQADGAVAVAAFHLLDPSGAGWRTDGQAHELQVKDDAFTSVIVIRASNLAGRIDLNSAPAPLLQALLAAVGQSSGAAAALAANIAAWRFPFGPGVPAAIAATPYKAAGLAYGPPGTPFETPAELGLVLGMTTPLLNDLLPYVTVYHQGDPDLDYAPPPVDRAVMAARAVIPISPGNDAGGLRVVEVSATAYGADGSRFTRDAIVQLGAQNGGWMNILTWTAP